ncbi:hypothetical protein M404DRAFT_894467 [Pisolithus tinctorius Marx 270]|uniref:Uncharacterized protein n=1 Tax=Pisolithus tinctorius Marx 270 TaxID=870435 RepID=A0A0C3NQ65_PISTI|nr:hypothetical protein M404DRAFT_894467 [Pisolithus tinctorius Marx 270]
MLGLQASIPSSSKTSYVTSCAHDVSDIVQIAAPVVQAAAEAILVAGAPMKAAIGGLLAILQVIDVTLLRFQVQFFILNLNIIESHSEQGRLKRPHSPTYNLSCHIAIAPTARTPFEEISRRALIQVLEDTTKRLREMRSRIHGSTLLTQQIVRCSSKINDHPLEYTDLSQMELKADAHHVADLMQVLVTKIQSIEQTVMAMEARHLPATIPLGYVTLVDATG